MPIADGTANTVFVGESMMRPHARLSPQGLREALAARVITNTRDRQAVARILDLMARRRTHEAALLLPAVQRP